MRKCLQISRVCWFENTGGVVNFSASKLSIYLGTQVLDEHNLIAYLVSTYPFFQAVVGRPKYEGDD